MTLEEKKDAVKTLVNEMTSSQSFGSRCANEMGVDENDLIEIEDFVLDLLKQAK